MTAEGRAGEGSLMVAAFTVESVRTLATKYLLHGEKGKPNGMNLPSDAALARLTFTLNQAKHPLHDLQQFEKKFGALRDHNQNIARLASAVEEIEDVLPKLLSQLYSQIRAHDRESTAAMIIDEATRSLSDLYGALPEVREHALFAIPPRKAYPDRLDWQRVARVIARQVQWAMRTTNPDADLGLSANGPIPRFVAAVLPSITGVKRDQGSIFNLLRRAAPRPGDKSE